jgi:hypothetical protein
MPPVNERVQEAPAGTLRAAFAGIGRFLKFTDKIRSKPVAGQLPARATAAGPEQAAGPQAPEETAVSPAAPAPQAETPAAAPEQVAPAEAAVPGEAVVPEETARARDRADGPVASPGAGEPAAPAARTEAAAPEAAEPSPDLPLANYDSLSIASVRARLRGLSLAQLGQLLEYERSHAGRADFIAAFERRITKIASEG